MFRQAIIVTVLCLMTIFVSPESSAQDTAIHRFCANLLNYFSLSNRPALPSSPEPLSDAEPQTESSAFRTRYARIAEAARSLKTLTLFHNSETDKNKKIVLGYIKNNSQQMSHERQQALLSLGRLDSQTEAIKNKILRIHDRIMTHPKLNLEIYHRLVFANIQFLELLARKNSLRGLILSSTTSTNEKFVTFENLSLLRSTEEYLFHWILNGSNQMMLATPLLDSIQSVQNGWVYILTFHDLDFSTLLWGLSRGITFVGQSSHVMYADNKAMSPTIFLMHDYLHGKDLTSKGRYRPWAKSFWDKVVMQLDDSSNQSKKEAELILSVLFQIFHERAPAVSMNYSSISNFLKVANSEDNSPFNSIDYLLRRLNDKKDMGSAFNEPVHIDELERARTRALEIVAQAMEN